MAGIYIHIPFCKKACTYCDFHFSTDQKRKEEMIGAMQKEIILRKELLNSQTINNSKGIIHDLRIDNSEEYIKPQEVRTIYFGGGTPSLLSTSELEILLTTIKQNFEISNTGEITIEANPDDVTGPKVKEWLNLGINRVSLGVQSFFEEDLLWMNRSHNSNQALNSISLLQEGGIENISADLIYGYPLLNDEKWAENLNIITRLNIPHVSCYSMTVERKTALDYQIRNGLSKAINEDQAAGQFIYLQSFLENAGYEHYEISNFSKPGRNSIHNTNYWKGEKYLGIGPSAHSFNGSERMANVANNAKYIDALNKGYPLFTTEVLSEKEKLNEYIMLNIRTIWGVDLSYILKTFGSKQVEIIKHMAERLIIDGLLQIENNQFLRLSNRGKLLTDHITSRLFF